MDATDRELLIERLRRENDEARERIRQRQEQRERNPLAYEPVADFRDTGLPGDLHFSDGSEPEDDGDEQPGALVEKSGAADGLIYRRFENASAGFPNDGEDEFEAAVEKFSAAVETRLHELGKENAELRAENVEVKGLLADALEKFSKLEGKCDAVLALMKGQIDRAMMSH